MLWLAWAVGEWGGGGGAGDQRGVTKGQKGVRRGCAWQADATVEHRRFKK
jgi:hypothetical protein